jgi:hypothetical protein
MYGLLLTKGEYADNAIPVNSLPSEEKGHEAIKNRLESKYGVKATYNKAITATATVPATPEHFTFKYDNIDLEIVIDESNTTNNNIDKKIFPLDGYLENNLIKDIQQKEITKAKTEFTDANF